MSTTLKEIQGSLDRINSILKVKGIEIHLGRRYGYKALDLYHTKNKAGGMIDTLQSGLSSSQVVNYLNAFLRGISLYTWGA